MGEYKQIVSKFLESVKKKIISCDKALEINNTLNDVKFEISYTPMPEKIKEYARYIDVAVKGILAPYMTKYQPISNRNKINVEILFNTENTVDMSLNTEEEEISYKNIYLPSKLRNIFPISVHGDSLQNIFKTLK